MKCRFNLCFLGAVAFILAAGCAPTQRQLQLLEASEKGDTGTVQALLAQGVDVNAKDNAGDTALMYTAAFGKTVTVQALLAHGADVNAKDNNGFTALIFAAGGGHT